MWMCFVFLLLAPHSKRTQHDSRIPNKHRDTYFSIYIYISIWYVYQLIFIKDRVASCADLVKSWRPVVQQRISSNPTWYWWHSFRFWRSVGWWAPSVSFVSCSRSDLFFFYNIIQFEYFAALQRCKAGDTSCLATTMTAFLHGYSGGHPELGLASIDPLYFGNLTVTQGGNGPVTAKLSLYEASIEGWRKAKVTKVV